MGYKTLVIRNSEKLTLYLDNIVVHTNSDEISYLISDLKMLIIDNYKTTLSTQLINKLIKSNVAIILCNMSHLPQTIMLSTSGSYMSSGMIEKQIAWSDEMKGNMHKKIVKSKIKSQIEILKKNNLSQEVIEKISEFEKDVQEYDSTNREGLAAKMYFREMFGKDFVRFNEDTINAGLNYGYAVFRSLITSIVVSKGLLPNIGIFHRGKTNDFNLSDDIIEVFRPIVDDYVLNNISNDELLTIDNRTNLISLTDLKIEFDGKMQTINNAIEMYLESIIRCFDENDSEYFMAPSLRRINGI